MKDWSSINTRRCSKCKQELPIKDFFADPSRLDGIECRCKLCSFQHGRGNGRPPGKTESSKRDDLGRKKCRLCGEWKDVCNYGPHKQAYDGLDGRCYECNRKRVAAGETNDRKQAFRKLAAMHRNRMMQISKRRYAMLADSCVCTAVLEELWQEQGGKCAITGVEMTHVAGEGRVYTNVSIDRVDSTAGYTRDNIRLVCVIVNIMKHTMSDEELLEWCRLILKDKRVKE